MSKVTLIIGSTRQNRVAENVAAWVTGQVAKHGGIELDVIDLKQENLPFFESPVPPLYAPDTTEHGLAWASKIAAGERFIFLTAEYNRSIPASLKNAIDYLVKEWSGKPAAIVSYGYIDAGQSATRHLRDILGWVKMQVVPTATHLQLAQDLFASDGSLADPAAFADQEAVLAQSLDELLAAQAAAEPAATK